MFRFNWPTSELLFGQYWSMFCEWYAESAEDGPLQMTGTPTARMAQIRFTQKFLGDWTVAGLIGEPQETRLPSAATVPYGAALTAGSAVPPSNNGEAAESPMVQGKVQYQHDFWGKAAYYGKPIPFTAQIVAGWQRNVMRSTSKPAAAVALQENAAQGCRISVQNTYVNPWLLMGSLFIPVVPTHSANLAGTASILTQWWIGQGVEAFGFAGVGGNQYKLSNQFINNAVSWL